MSDLCVVLWTIWRNMTWRQRGELAWIAAQLLPFLPLIVFVILFHQPAKD